MGRPRGFDEEQVVAQASDLFITHGYEATSIDEIVEATGLHRGSLYKAFGSKRGLFVASVRRLVDEQLPQVSGAGSDPLVEPEMLDLLLVAALEAAPHDEDVRDLVERACALLAESPGESCSAATLLGRRLLQRAGLRDHLFQQVEETKSWLG